MTNCYHQYPRSVQRGQDLTIRWTRCLWSGDISCEDRQRSGLPTTLDDETLRNALEGKPYATYFSRCVFRPYLGVNSRLRSAIFVTPATANFFRFRYYANCSIQLRVTAAVKRFSAHTRTSFSKIMFLSPSCQRCVADNSRWLFRDELSSRGL